MVMGTVMIIRAFQLADEALRQRLKLDDMTEMITDMVPGQIDEVMPELPTTTGACQSNHHFSVGGWIVVMSFRPEAFSLDFRHVKFWRGCLRFLLKRRQPFA